jgi:hypothetical protein
MPRACASWCWSGRRDSAARLLPQPKRRLPLRVCSRDTGDRRCADQGSNMEILRWFSRCASAFRGPRVRTAVVCFRELARPRVDLRHPSCITPAICGEEAARLIRSVVVVSVRVCRGNARRGHKSLQRVAATPHARRELCVERVGLSVTRALASSPSPRRWAHPAEG